MTKSLLGGGAAAALLSVSLIFNVKSSVAESLAQTSQKPTDQQKSDALSPDTLIGTTRPRSVNTSEAADSTSTIASTAENDRSGLPILPASKIPFSAITPVATETLVRPQSFVATAYSLRGRTASGRTVAKGLIAADRRVLPLGTRVRLHAGSYTGEYVVADTGGAIRGRKIDIWMPNTREALRFGRKNVKLTVLRPAIKRRRTLPQRASTPQLGY